MEILATRLKDGVSIVLRRAGARWRFDQWATADGRRLPAPPADEAAQWFATVDGALAYVRRICPTP